MARWISSKLKVAETLLQQIDQQAAESLRKGEKSRSDELELESPSRSGNGGGIAPPLKDQLKKRIENNSDSNYSGKLPGNSKNQNFGENSRKGNKEIANTKNLESSIKSGGTDTDWTQLLNVPDQKRATAPAFSSSGVRRDGRRPGTLGLSPLEGKRVNKGNSSGSNKLLRETEAIGKNKFDGVVSDQRLTDGEESSFSTSSVGGLDSGASNVNYVEESEINGIDNVEVGDVKDGDLNGFKDIVLEGGKSEAKDFSISANGDHSFAKASVAVDVISVMKMLPSNSHTKLESLEKRVEEDSNASSTSLVLDDLKKSPSSITVEDDDDEGSDSDIDSGSSSDSESEREREERRRRRQQILAEKAAAKAALAIKEHEDIVARLEGEKQSLEKILEDRAKQHVQEASELQMNMMETMEAVELEKQKHNNTRMEALARLAKLETENAELARSLAAAQWNLEVEVNQVADIRQQIEEKEVAHEELRRRILNKNQSGISLNQLRASKGVEFEREIQEAEYAFITDKIGRLQEKAKILDANIESTRKEMESPTEVELQLKRRLSQLTDHLIQKQAQVEGLSSEKATLLFRIEAISRTLEENKTLMNMTDSRIDLESGKWDFSKLKSRPSLQDKMRSGQQQLGSLLKQLDAIFSSGAAFLRRNPTARWWSLVYLVCLHFWVVYILMSHTQTSDDAKSGAVISLESINNTGGV